ncbi:MAG: AEC family transporter [Candidatus Brocadiia bacterium]
MAEELARVLHVLQISLPIFALIGLGTVLRRVGMVGPQIQGFLSSFVYRICLPVIIFFAIAPEDFGNMLNGAVIGATLTGAALTAVIFWLLSIRIPDRARAPLVVSTFFANTAFIGFPLVQSAYPEDGMMYASIINAVAMPIYYIASVLLLEKGEEEHGRIKSAAIAALKNPVLLAAVAGLIASALLHEIGLLKTAQNWPVVPEATGIIMDTAGMIGKMGLPLALITVGASLKFSYLRSHLNWMSMGCAGKLLVAPFLGHVICLIVFPDMQRAALGSTVLLLGCPMAVGIYIISREMDVNDDYMAGALVLSTVLAAASITFWLYVLGV